MSRLVYLHRRPDGRIFYVGKGDLKRARNKSNRSEYWKNVAKKGYSIEIAQDNLTDDEAFELEVFIIKTIGIDNLCNHHEGGLGGNRIKWTDKKREEHSKRLKGINKGVSRPDFVERNKRRMSKIVLNKEQGIFYNSIKDAAEHNGITYACLKSRFYKGTAYPLVRV